MLTHPGPFHPHTLPTPFYHDRPLVPFTLTHYQPHFTMTDHWSLSHSHIPSPILPWHTTGPFHPHTLPAPFYHDIPLVPFILTHYQPHFTLGYHWSLSPSHITSPILLWQTTGPFHPHTLPAPFYHDRPLVPFILTHYQPHFTLAYDWSLSHSHITSPILPWQTPGPFHTHRSEVPLY